MKYILELSDELARTLQRYADEHGATPEAVLTALVREIPSTPPTEQAIAETHPQADDENDPWAGFYGRYEADVPDISVHHDEYLAEAYMETHDDDK